MPPIDVIRVVNKLAGRWRECPPIKVLESIDDPDMPLFIRMAIHEYDERGAQGPVQGFVHEGEVFLVADNLPTEKSVIEALLHESVGHWGLGKVFGSDMNNMLDHVYENMPPLLIHNKADHYGFNINLLDERRKIAEEYLCDLAQAGKKNSLLDSAMAIIRSWMREHTSLLDDSPMSDAELVRNYIEPARRFVEKGRVMSPAQRKELAGRKEHLTRISFKRFFHGSSEQFDSFSANKLGQGYFGHGLYLAEDSRYATQYAVTTAEFHLVDKHGAPRITSLEENWVARYLFLNENDYHATLDVICHPDNEMFVAANNFARRKLADWREDGLKATPSTGVLYEAEVPDNAVFLESEVCLYNQPEIMKRSAALVSAVGKGDWLTGREFYAELAKVTGGDREASAALLEHGIDGLAYTEQAKSMTGGIGGRCLVLFDVARAVIRNVFIQGDTGHDGLDEPDHQPASRKGPAYSIT